jgi:hypothetical protein
MSPLAFGGLAMVSFLLLLGVLWFFRGVAAKIADTGVHGDGTDHHQGSHH